MSMFKDMFKRGFWDDSDGLSLLDFIAIWVMLAWGVVMLMVIVLALYAMYNGKTLDPFWLDFLEVFADVPLGVVIGLFGKGAFGELGHSMATFKQRNQCTTYQEGSGIYDDKGESYRV